MLEDKHHAQLCFKDLLLCLCSTGTFTLTIMGMGCAYFKEIQVLSDGRIGGPGAIMSWASAKRLESLWNSLRHTTGFPYMSSNFEDLLLWEWVIFALDPSAICQLTDSLGSAVRACGLAMFAPLARIIDERALVLCASGAKINHKALRRHRNKAAEKVHSMMIHLKVAQILWDRVKPKSKTKVACLQG